MISRKSRLYLVVAYIGLCALLGLWQLARTAQDRFYYPSRGESLRTPESAGLPFEELYFNSLAGTRLHGWFIPAVGETKGVVLHVHGNMGRLDFNLEPVLWLPKEHYAVMVFDYRGYGLSDDKKPTPKALMEDTQSAIRYLKNRKDIDASNLLILAQSLGGNNTVAALTHDKFEGIAGIVLDSTFYSYKTIADDHLPGIGNLLNDEYSASRFIRQLAPIPLLFLHGDEDEVIAHKHSQMLFAAASSPKELVIVPGARHLNVLLRRDIQEKVLRFFEPHKETHVLSPQSL